MSKPGIRMNTERQTYEDLAKKGCEVNFTRKVRVRGGGRQALACMRQGSIEKDQGKVPQENNAEAVDGVVRHESVSQI